MQNTPNSCLKLLLCLTLLYPALQGTTASFIDAAQAFAERIQGYWGVEKKVHYVRDVTQCEGAERIRTSPLVQIWALARNFILNLYRDHGFQNMAQAQRRAGFSLNAFKDLFRMK